MTTAPIFRQEVLLTGQFLLFTMADSSVHPLVMESAGKMYALAIVLGLLAIVATALRFYARRMKQASLSWDDYMILPALVRCALSKAPRQLLRAARLTWISAFHTWHSRLHDHR